MGRSEGAGFFVAAILGGLFISGPILAQSQYEQQYQQQYPKNPAPNSSPGPQQGNQQRRPPPNAKQRQQLQGQNNPNQPRRTPPANPALRPKAKPTPTPAPAAKPVAVVKHDVAPQGPLLSLGPDHLLPSALVIPGGTFFLGTGAGVGVGNIFDLSTNLFLDVESVYNVELKFKLYKGRNAALAAWVSYVNSQDSIAGIDQLGNPTIVTITSSSVTPGLTFSYRIARRITGHVGGDVALMNPVIPKSSLVQRTSYIQGNQVFKEFTFGLGEFVALSVGGSYDLTYDVWGAGLTFHLSGIDLGAHYYLNVSQGSFLPIIGAGYAVNF